MVTRTKFELLNQNETNFANKSVSGWEEFGCVYVDRNSLPYSRNVRWIIHIISCLKSSENFLIGEKLLASKNDLTTCCLLDKQLCI
jgi:hypothetical protein